MHFGIWGYNLLKNEVLRSNYARYDVMWFLHITSYYFTLVPGDSWDQMLGNVGA